MLIQVIAWVLISFILLLSLFMVIVGIRLHQTGLLSTFLRHKWQLGVLTGAFTILFLVACFGLLAQAGWAKSLLNYTIWGWLIYTWLYNLFGFFQLQNLKKADGPKSFSQFMGRSKLYDRVLEKSLEISQQPQKTEAGEAII